MNKSGQIPDVHASYYQSLIIVTAVFDLLVLIASISCVMIPAWHIPSLNNENEYIRTIVFPIGCMASTGSMYMLVLLSFERYKAQYGQRTLNETLSTKPSQGQREYIKCAEYTLFEILN